MGSYHRPADGQSRQDALSARHMLAGWISLIPEDHSWDAEAGARHPGRRRDPAPAPVLDSILCRLERRPN